MLTELLTGWIAKQRWFAGKGRPIDEVSIDSCVPLGHGDPALAHLVLTVRQGDRQVRYQLLLGLRDELPDRLKHVAIGRCEWDGRQRVAYDAAHDQSLTGALLTGMAEGRTEGPLSFHRRQDAPIETSLRSLVMRAEQSNTSIVYGDAYILKLFRALVPGVNPELEIVTALADAGSTHVAKPYGWIEGEVGGEPTTLAFMQEFLANSSEGWAMALTSVRDFYACPDGCTPGDAGGDFASEAFRLGAATAEVHRELAASFPTATIDPTDVKRMAERFRHRLEEAVNEVPALEPYAEVAHKVFDKLADVGRPVPVQRVHGDYHLGQVMRARADWVVLDFEGEPGRPLAERVALDSPLRDVAGMLRSFEYAARHLLAGNHEAAKLAPKAAQWATRNRDAFLAGYTEAGGALSGEDAVLLRALELSKAVYEVVYESRNRPTWVGIPLAAFGG